MDKIKPTFKYTNKEILNIAKKRNDLIKGKDYGKPFDITKKEAEREYIKGWRESAKKHKGDYRWINSRKN
jgi:hypothetical protein